jgi:DHA2 family multidrug resistance protein
MSRESKLIVFVAVLASLLEIIDTSIVNVAIPTMMGNLGATLEDISMVVTGYSIANAIVLPLAAWLGSRLGRRRYYLGCIILFTVASVACGFAPNLQTLVVFRIFQGLAGGALLPTSQSLIYEQFPKEKAGMAGAIFGMSVMIGPTLGPTLGGYLTDHFGWRSIFNVNLPIGILTFFLGFIAIKNVGNPSPKTVPSEHEKENAGAAQETRSPESEKKPGIDIIGLMLLTLSIGCLQFLLERGDADEWFDSKIIRACLVGTVLATPLFIWWELKIKNPILNLRLFKDGVVTNGVMLQTFLGFFLFAIIFILPNFASIVFHYDATQTGTLFIPGSILTALCMPFVGRMLDKGGPKTLIFIGLVGLEVCLFMLSRLSINSSRDQLYYALYVRGFALAFLFVPINSSILSQFSGINLGQVSGMLNLFRQIGGSIGIAVLNTLLTRNSHQIYLKVVSNVTMLNQATQIAMAQGAAGMSGRLQGSVGSVVTSGSQTAQVAALRSIAARVQAQVFILNFGQLMTVMAGIILFAFIPLYLLKFRKKVAAVADSH